MSHRTSVLVTLITCGACCTAVPAFAVDGTWINTSGGFQSWTTPGNWSGGTIAGGIDATANITANITAAQSVQTQAPRTVGHLNVSDPNNSHNYTFSGDITLDVTSGNATITVGNAGQRFVADRIKAVAAIGVAGADTLEKKGPGTLFINFDPSGQSQKWLLSAGTFEISSSADRLGSNPSSFTADAVTFNGGTLRPSIIAGTLSMGQSNQGFTMGASGGTFKVDGTATLALTANPTPALITGAGGLTKTGAGILEIRGDNNDYAGDTLVSEGELRLATNNNILPNGAGKGNVTVSAGATLNLNDRSDTINGLSGAGTVKSVSGTQTLTLGDGNANGSFSGTLDETGGTLNLTKAGSGAQTLAAGSTLSYLGTTNVNGGTLFINSTKSGSGAVNVNSGGTLAGTGTINGPTTVLLGGTLAPGASIGTLSTASVSFASGSAASIEIDLAGSMSADLLIVASTLSLGGSTLSLSVLNAPPVLAPTTFLLIRNDGVNAVSGVFGAVTGLPAGYTGTLNYAYAGTDVLGRLGTGNDVALTLTAVPEPGTIIVWGLALICMACGAKSTWKLVA